MSFNLKSWRGRVSCDIAFEARRVHEELCSGYRVGGVGVGRVERVGGYTFPSLNLLKDYSGQGVRVDNIGVSEAGALEERLREFGINCEVVNVRRGPVITRYEARLGTGSRLSQVRGVSEDLAVALMAGNVRILAPIPGTNLIGFEIVNECQFVTGLRTVLAAYDGRERLPIALGVDTVGRPKILDLTVMPHLLVAGQTGSGKSVYLNTIILSVLFTRRPEECRLVLVDPKRVEMTSYRNLPHLFRPVVTEPREAVGAFAGLVAEMERRYRILEASRVRNIESYNGLAGIREKMPYIVAIVDEMSDLMMTSGKELEALIVRLAQLARAVGIHLVLATQKPVVKVITGLIKSNMPSRIAFQVASGSDSRVILDYNGAERLAGRGDMLLLGPGMPEPERFHGAWVSDEEIATVTQFITNG